MDQGSTMKRSAVHNFVPTVTKFCVMWEGLSLPHDTKFGNSRCEIVGSRVIFIWSLIHGLRWSGLIKAEPGTVSLNKSVRWGIRSNAKVCFILWNKTMHYSRAPPKLGWGILRWKRLKIFEYWWGQLSNIKSWWPKLIKLSVWKSFFLEHLFCCPIIN